MTIRALWLLPALLLPVACQEGAPVQAEGVQADAVQADAVQVVAASTPTTPRAGDEVMDGCPESKKERAGEPHSCGDEPPASGADGHFGSPFALDRSEPLTRVASELGDEKKTVQVQGKVESVCQKAGCWMVLADGETRARIFTKGHGFFLPRDIAGRGAVVEGELAARTITEGFARHLEEDRGGDPAKVTGPKRELVMNATAVALR